MLSSTNSVELSAGALTIIGSSTLPDPEMTMLSPGRIVQEHCDSRQRQRAIVSPYGFVV